VEPELSGQVAWVTGAAGGIGAAVVDELARRGARVGALDLVDPPEGCASAASVVGDVADAPAVAAAAAHLEAALGPPDIVVHAAGISARALVVDTTDHLWDRVLGVNLTGTFYVTRQVLGGMLARGHGRVVCIASGSAVRVTAGTSAYGASKAGVIAFARGVAHEGAERGVTCNVVAPGIVDTPMTRRAWPTDEEMWEMATASPIANPMKVILVPADIARAVAFLAGPGAARITGQTLHVNGGSYMA